MSSYILTFDYELFGSGKGCVIEHLVKPTNKILAQLQQLNTKATFFVEQLEVDAVIALKKQFPTTSKEYSDAVALENQLEAIVLQGHDVQLHLHPQWHDAKYKDGQWQLNFDWWRFSALPYHALEDGTPGKYELIKQGKASLEARIKPIKADYICHSFRAGGYNVGNDKTTVDALINNGILLDSSVCPGFFSNSKLSQYDYTVADPALAYWYASDNLLVANNEKNEHQSCIELPLITVKSSFKEKLSLARMYATITNKKLKDIAYIGENLNNTPFDNTLITNTNFDVCLSSKAQIKKLSQRVKQLSKGNDNYPITLIGHPKDFSYFSPMNKLIKFFKKSDSFITIDIFVKGVGN